MRTEDLPESNNVADRRNKPKPVTLQDHIDQAEAEPQPERGAPDPTSDLAKSLGVDHIGKVAIALVGYHLGFVITLVILA